MKNIFLGTLVSLFTLATTPVMAAEVSPMNLVFQGYQGRLASEGIPGYAAFLQAVYLGKLDAKTIVEGAVAQGKLDAKLADDQSYLRQVDSALFSLRTGGASR